MRAWMKLLSMLILLTGAALAQTPPPGAALFEQRCYSCHNVGDGNKIGPDLKGVTERRKKGWLQSFILSPATLNSQGDPTATELFKQFAPAIMPDQTLTPAQIDEILALIADLSQKNQNFAPTGAALSRAVVASDVQAGHQLFTGSKALSNGGTACISCHSMKDIGALGGGMLGPDLTLANARYRDPELISILRHPNFPTMNSVFGAHPLSDEEIVQLFALLQDARKTAQTTPFTSDTSDYKFPLIGMGTLVIALAGMNLTWKNRHRGVREEIVKRSKI